MDNRGRDWSEEELWAAVEAYRSMQRMASGGQSFTKKQIYEALGDRFGRSPKAFEYRMQNISAVLDALGKSWLPGLPPATNVGDRTSIVLKRLLSSEPGYRRKLPSMRYWLIGAAKKQRKVTYGALMAAFDIDRFSLRAALGRLGHDAKSRGEPIITAMVVNAVSGRCSNGIEKEFGVSDDEAERMRLHQFWETRSEPRPEEPDAGDDSLAARASRFARAKVRPEQARFRRSVFMRCQGKCVISGCDLDVTLDAAHLKGRSWEKGHNKPEDGVLLRKDLHALYDAGHLLVTSAGSIVLGSKAELNYPELVNAKVSPGNWLWP